MSTHNLPVEAGDYLRGLVRSSTPHGLTWKQIEEHRAITSGPPWTERVSVWTVAHQTALRIVALLGIGVSSPIALWLLVPDDLEGALTLGALTLAGMVWDAWRVWGLSTERDGYEPLRALGRGEHL